MRQLTVGEYVLLDELASAATDRTPVGVLGGDAMVHHQPALSHGAEQRLAVLLKVGMADMFEHADADHFVEAAVLGQVAVIQQLQFDLTLQAFGLDPFPGQGQLRLAQGDTEDLGTELPRGVSRQTTPAAPDVQQVIAWLQSQLAAKMTEFGLLGLLKVSLPVSK